MPDVGSENVEITPQKFEALRQRLESTKPGTRKLWVRPCKCSCGCPIEHPGKDTWCAPCRQEDHWTRITEYLDRAMSKESA